MTMPTIIGLDCRRASGCGVFPLFLEVCEGLVSRSGNGLVKRIQGYQPGNSWHVEVAKPIATLLMPSKVESTLP